MSPIDAGTSRACWKTKRRNASHALRQPCSATDCVSEDLFSGETSREQFKIQLGNVNKHVTVKVMKKFLQSRGFITSKIKPVSRGFFYITFRSAKDRDEAVEKLNGFVFKGRSLEAKVPLPALDPVLLSKLQSKYKEGGKGDYEPFLKKMIADANELTMVADPVFSVAPLYKVTYDPDQLKIKAKNAIDCLKKVRNAVRSVNKINYCDFCLKSGFMSSASGSLNQEFCPITPSPLLVGYRNKAKFTIGMDINGKSPVVGVRLGKYRQGSTAVAYPTAAPIFSPTTHAVVNSMQACLDAIYHHPHAPENAALLSRVAVRLHVYDVVNKTGNWCALTVRESRLGDCLVEVEIRRDGLTDEDLVDLQSVLKQWFHPGGPGGSMGVTSVLLVVLNCTSSPSETPTALCVFGKETITELCCGLKFVISSDAFFQVNTPATEMLYEEVRGRCKSILAEEDKSTRSAILLDICCGTGTIALCLADCFERVIGIELTPSAVENAKLNAKLNGITNAQFYVGRAELVLKDLIHSLPEDKTIIAVLDPPRAGVNHGVVEAIRRCERIRNLIFLACDLSQATPNFEAFARPPSKKYVGDPFLPTIASCLDLFPHTPSIEVVLSLKRLSSSNCDHGSGDVPMKTTV